MNRRSILSSLSSMCLAALAWPRNAAGAGGDVFSKTKYFYYVKVKNAFVGEDGTLTPGSSELDVWAYNKANIASLTGGAVRLYKYQNSSGGIVTAEISADFPLEPKSPTTIKFDQGKNTTLYYLAYADSLTRTRRITIKQAPPGVIF